MLRVQDAEIETKVCVIALKEFVFSMAMDTTIQSNFKKKNDWENQERLWEGGGPGESDAYKKHWDLRGQ